MSVFVNINPEFLANKIHSAHSKVIYVSPGVDEVIANALIDTSKKIGADNVSVLLDVSENVLRYGYGNIDGIKLLKENEIPIKGAEGLRIGALVYDDAGIIFTPIPLSIEAGKKYPNQPNAINATQEQVNDIIDAITPPINTQDLNEKLDDSNNENPPQISDPEPEIGKVEISPEQIEEVNDSITKNPPLKVDVAQKVLVFSTKIEFVEIKLKGCAIQRHTVSIPPELLIGQVDSATKRQLRAGYTIIEKGSSISGDSIRDEVNELRKSFTESIPKYGSVLLKSKKKEFNIKIKEIKKNLKEFQKKVNTDLEGEIKKAKDNLLNVLIPSVTASPPHDLLKKIDGENVDKKLVKKYLSLRLDEIFPSADKIVNAMSLECISKAVTHETISNEEFLKHIKYAYPFSDWDKMFEEYGAARESHE